MKFHLNERIQENLTEFNERRETSSGQAQTEVFGREVDRDRIVKVLTKDICDAQGVSVYPIIGMGGLGKTTLAQMVLNDGRIKDHFDTTIWVYVSPDFNVKRVMKLIIESVSGESRRESSLDSLQGKVRTELSGKRYLLVLDDLWNEDEGEWDKLKYALSNGSPGACILVTTRSEKVTSIIRALPTDHLSGLSEDDCWLQFRQRAFELHEEERPELVAIGKDIVSKCGGVPLAAKALGGLMRSKIGVKEWVNIKESNLWDLPQEEVAILPALRLSYYNLPLEMRHCFSYCAIFPKGSRMKKYKLIQLWTANGFISSRGRMDVEDVGIGVWNELYKRSLFLKDDKDPEDMFMHDLVHDLARSIIEDDCYTMEARRSSTIPKQRIRHATLVSYSKRTSVFPEALRGNNKLHSILLQDRGYFDDEYQCEFSCDFKNFGSLRVFDANGARIMQLSGSIQYSKHLTYLNLYRTPITELPASICSLHHLQTLNLSFCRVLRRLPKKMHRLSSLRHLFLLGSDMIEDTPPNFRKLTKLKILSFFVVGESGGQHLDELQHLDIGGELELRHLERVRNPMDAKEANLVGKQNLDALKLCWKYSEEVEDNMTGPQEEVIEALEPHPNIKELTIQEYRGKELPVWMSNPSVLRNVVQIIISDCTNCLGLPALGNLPFLKHLIVHGIMEKMEYMFPNGNNNVAFLSLEKMYIFLLPNLKGLLMEEEEEGTAPQQQLFPRLRKMRIRSCPELVLPTLPKLEKLEFSYISSVRLLSSFSKLTSLTSLRLCWNDDMVGFPDEMLQNLTLLQSLIIQGFKSLKVLPENMSRLSSLLNLSISQCPEILSLPDSIQILTQLQSFRARDCSRELRRRCEKETGQDWYKIKHIPEVLIKTYTG